MSPDAVEARHLDDNACRLARRYSLGGNPGASGPALPDAICRAVGDVAGDAAVGIIASHRVHRGLRGRRGFAIAPKSVLSAADPTVSRLCVVAEKFFAKCDHAAFPITIQLILPPPFYRQSPVCKPTAIARIGNTGNGSIRAVGPFLLIPNRRYLHFFR